MSLTIAPQQWVLLGALAGLLGAVAMGYPMSRGATGFVPARVATAFVTRRRPEDVPFAGALAFHLTAGVGAGGGYALLSAGLSAGLDETLPTLLPLPGGIGVGVHLLATAAVSTAVYLTFAGVVFPHVGGRAYEERETEVQGRWIRATLAFGATLAVAVPAFASAVV